MALKPVIIAEMGSGEFIKGDMNKAAWITQSFARIKADYPWIKMYTWFNIKKELVWRVNSSREALEAFRTAMADPYFLSTTCRLHRSSRAAGKLIGRTRNLEITS